MSDSGESDESERLSDLDTIAEALRAGEMDTATRFSERRLEKTGDRLAESDQKSPSDILTDVRAQNDEADRRDGRATIVVELVLRLDRDELVPDKLNEQLLQRFSPDLPAESIEVHGVNEIAQDRDQVEIRVTVSIDSDAVVDELLFDSQSDNTPDAKVKRVT